jgi:hypothetical protein
MMMSGKKDGRGCLTVDSEGRVSAKYNDCSASEACWHAPTPSATCSIGCRARTPARLESSGGQLRRYVACVSGTVAASTSAVANATRREHMVSCKLQTFAPAMPLPHENHVTSLSGVWGFDVKNFTECQGFVAYSFRRTYPDSIAGSLGKGENRAG